MSSYQADTGVIVLLSILDVLTVICNLAVLLLIIHKPTLRTVSNILVCGLAMTDFLMATLIVPFSIIGYKNQVWSYNDTLCIVQGYLFNMLYIVSASFTSIISIDRYYSLASPMSHTANVKGSYVIWTVIFVILHSAFWVNFPLYGLEGLTYSYLPKHSRCSFNWAVSGPLGTYLFFVVLVTFVVPVFASVVMYYKSVQAALDSARKIRPGNVHIERFANGDFTSVAKTENIGSTKAVLTVSVIIGSFVICRAPILVCSIGAWYHGHDFCSFKLELGFSWLQYLGSLTNPFVYVLLNRRLRTELKTILKSWAFHQDEEDEEPKDILDYLRNITNNERDSTLPARDRFSVGTSRFSTEIETLQFGPESNGIRTGSRDTTQSNL